MKQTNNFYRRLGWLIGWLSLALMLGWWPAQPVLAQGGSSGDVNGDGRVDILDLAFIATHYGSADPAADTNGDGIVNVLDLAIVAGHYNQQEEVEPQIIGGHEAEPGEYPWQVRLDIEATGGTFLCGGSLIGREWVLTAAHCITDPYAEGGTNENLSNKVVSPEAVTVYLGDYQISETDPNEQQKPVSQVIRHPDYRSSGNDFDIALLKLSSPANLSGSVQPITLNTKSNIDGLLARVTGWGDIDSTDIFEGADILQELFVPIVSNGTCNGPESYDGQITENMLCAGLASGGRDSCQGDSGGPLIIYDSTRQRWVQAGVVSFGQGCALPNFYGVYARVSKFTDWINAQVGPVQPPTPGPYYYLTGRVTELVRPCCAYGYIRQPIYGVRVEATSNQGQRYTAMTRSGYFAFKLPAGTYTLKPLKEGYSFWPPAATVNLRYNTSYYFTGHRRYGPWAAQAEVVETDEGSFLGGELGPVSIEGEAGVVTAGEASPLQLSLDSPANEAVVGGVLQVEGGVTGGRLDRVELWLDDDTEPHLAQLEGDRYQGVIETGQYRDGEHNLLVIAYDQAGNLKAEVRTIFIDNGQGQDTTPPEVTVDNLADEARLSGLFTLEGQASDEGGGVERIEIWLDEAAEPTLAHLEGDHYTWEFQTEGASEGQHTVAVIAYDIAGNSNGQVRTFWVER
jgi:secreted trypsin-like serine protease